jgi:hypothetical protein
MQNKISYSDLHANETWPGEHRPKSSKKKFKMHQLPSPTYNIIMNSYTINKLFYILRLIYCN